MVGIQSAKLLRFLGALQLSFDIAVLRAVARFQPQAAIGPQLPLGTEPMGRLHQCDQLSRPNRTDTRDLAKQFGCVMLPALGQKILPHFTAQALQRVQLLVIVLGATAHASFSG